jgi:DNA replication protein DnaC
MKRIGEFLPNVTPRKLSNPVPAPPQPEPECKICGDVGFLRADVDVGHPDFGKLIECECTLRKRKLRTETDLDRRSSLNAFHDSTFEDFDQHVPGIEEAFDIAYAFSQGQTKPWLLFSGPVGVGKTHLAVAIGKHLKAQDNVEVIFTVVPDLLDHLRASFDPTAEHAYDSRFNQIRNAQLLILDDLGTENATPWAREKLFQIINHRYTERFPTIITTNTDLAKIEDRIASRIMDSRLTEWIQIDAQDFRRPGYSPRVRRTRR